MKKNEENATPAPTEKPKKPVNKFGWFCIGFGSSMLTFALALAVTLTMVPMKTFFGKNSDDYVNEAAGNQTIINFLLNYQDYTLSSFPILRTLLKNAIEENGLDAYVTIDYDKLETYSFSNLDLNEIFNNCVTITATIRSIGAVDMLGDLSKLDCMQNNTAVTGTPDTSASDFNPKMYYYLDADDKLARAYSDEGVLAEAAVGQQLYYPALVDIPVIDALDIIGDRIAQEEVLDLLGIFTDFSSDSLIKKIFKDMRLSDLGSFNADGILLSDVIEYNSDTETMFKVICSAVKTDGEKPTWDTVTIGDLNHIDLEQVHLTDVMAVNDDNRAFYDTILAATGCASYDDITLSKIYDADMDKVPLVDMLSYSGNENLYDVLIEATGKSDYKKITIGDLYYFDMDNIHVATVMPGLSDSLKNIFVKGCGVSDYSEITLASLTSFDINLVPLSLVIEDNAANASLISILTEATGVSDYSEITMANLNGLSMDNVRLVSIMPDNDKLFTILSEATGIAKDELRMSDLNGFSIDNIKLSTLIEGSTGNAILDKLLEDDSATVANLGTKLNTMRLYDVYGEGCFTQDSANTFLPADHYEKQGESFVYDTDGDYDGDYYVAKTSGAMMLYAFTVTGYDTACGRPTTYAGTSTTISDLGTLDADCVKNATIYQLIASGILEDSGYSDNLKKHTIQEILDAVSSLY